MLLIASRGRRRQRCKIVFTPFFYGILNGFSEDTSHNTSLIILDETIEFLMKANTRSVTT